MEVRFGNLDGCYRLLKQGRPLGDGEEWKDISDEDNVYRTIKGLGYDEISLPQPLKSLKMVFHRLGDFYSCIIPILAEDDRVFLGMEDGLQKTYGKRWVPVSGGGYILDQPLDTGELLSPEFSILNLKNKEVVGRVIAMGTHGTKLKKLGDFESFTESAKSLETLINLCLNSCLSQTEGQLSGEGNNLCLVLNL